MSTKSCNSVFVISNFIEVDDCIAVFDFTHGIDSWSLARSAWGNSILGRVKGITSDLKSW
jgi:hypothetical protein